MPRVLVMGFQRDVESAVAGEQRGVLALEPRPFATEDVERNLGPVAGGAFLAHHLDVAEIYRRLAEHRGADRLRELRIEPQVGERLAIAGPAEHEGISLQAVQIGHGRDRIGIDLAEILAGEIEDAQARGTAPPLRDLEAGSGRLARLHDTRRLFYPGARARPRRGKPPPAHPPAPPRPPGGEETETPR